MVNAHANVHLTKYKFWKPVNERLAFLLLIDLTIGNNATADSANVLNLRVFVSTVVSICCQVSELRYIT